MKYILILFALPVFVAVIYSCGTNDKKHTDNPITKIDFQIIKTGVLHGAGEEGFTQEFVGVTSYEDYYAIRDKMNSVNEELKDDIIPDLHFFDEQMLVFVFDKVRGTGGYTFKVKHAVVQNDTIILTVFSKRPEEPATSIMTQPFQIISLDRFDKEIKLMLIE